MDIRNLNEIMKQDPSLENGKFVIAFERKCPIEMKIVEQSILQMIGQDISKEEEMNFKIMVKGKVNEAEKIQQMQHNTQKIEPLSARLAQDKNQRNEDIVMHQMKNSQFTDFGNSQTFNRRLTVGGQKTNYSGQLQDDISFLKAVDAESNPEIVRLEVTSDFDYFMQYIYEQVVRQVLKQQFQIFISKYLLPLQIKHKISSSELLKSIFSTTTKNLNYQERKKYRK